MADEEKEIPYVPQGQNDEFVVVCKDCRTILNSERVMKSAWYADGMLPPCFSCGGVTMEIPQSAYNKFLEDSRAGKRFW
jgi:hypothetical protein